MFRLTIFSILFLFVFPPSGKSFQVSPTGLIAHYNFNRDLSANESILWDVSGKDNHGNIIGDISYVPDRFGVDCGALHFDGKSYCSVPSSPSLNKPEYALTIAAWLKIDPQADFFKQWITVCCKSDLTEETYTSPQYRMQATAQTISLNTEFTEVFIPPLDYDTWYFYAIVFDGISVRVFINGQFVFEMLYPGQLYPNDRPLEIGRDAPGYMEFFKGTLDDLKIYSRALRESELTALFREGNPDPEVQSWCEKPVFVAPVVAQPQPQPIKPVDPPLPARDTTAVDVYAALPSSVEGTKVAYQSVVEVARQEVVIYLFDNEKEDGDIISLNINGIWVRENFRLRLKTDTPVPEAMIRCILSRNSDNFLISKAINLGSIPPNTLTIAIDDGSGIQEVTINSDVGINGGILLKVK